MAILALISFLFLLLGLWAALFYAPYLAVLSFLGFLAFLPVLVASRTARRVKVMGGITLLVVTLLTIWAPIGEVNRRVGVLHKQARYSTRDEIGVWGLNVVMAACGFPLYPEAAIETALMVLPRPEKDTIVFHSGFALRSRVVRDILGEFVRRLQGSYLDAAASTDQQVDLWVAVRESSARVAAGTVRSRLAAVRDAFQDSRCALALNPVTVTVTATRQGKRWRMDVRSRVWVGYAETGVAELVPPVVLLKPNARARGIWKAGLSWSGLVMHERPFWVLQQDSVGWLHPYYAEYRCVIYSDDPRLHESQGCDGSRTPHCLKLMGTHCSWRRSSTLTVT